ncbi:hypothetical protein [Acidipropionibacterium virtanenii]|uniref:Uncharacterized protein n=1 Tax=Acidipropionibacterium virtanenii TaxID=2057246 RepID=A0A344UQV3_9ACTN|nr:hypothetical protein [Acidipropionibacterium virtanenii]AXE37651.1 hypothetical protein JS278_00458 [Acidipropionibacterium virtanenii]
MQYLMLVYLLRILEGIARFVWRILRQIAYCVGLLTSYPRGALVLLASVLVRLAGFAGIVLAVTMIITAPTGTATTVSMFIHTSRGHQCIGIVVTTLALLLASPWLAGKADDIIDEAAYRRHLRMREHVNAETGLPTNR